MTGLAAGPARASALAEDGVVRIGYLPITDAASLLVAPARGPFASPGPKVEQPFMARSLASLVAPFDYAAMLLALAIGWFVFAEMPTLTMLMGAAIIIIAGILIILRERKLGKDRAAARKVTTLQG